MRPRSDTLDDPQAREQEQLSGGALLKKPTSRLARGLQDKLSISNQIKEAWNNATTTWGKLAVLMFYIYIWLGILSGLVSVMFPASQGIDCYNAHFDAPTQQIVMSQMRVENLLYIVVYLFLGVDQTHICTVTVLAIVTMLCYCFSRPAMIELDADCWNGVKTSIVILSFAPVVIWILVVVEFALTRRRGTGPESQPLV